ncbi:FeoB-associated Cys-rich membrane protein [Vibrio variabilis]|uniref:FeoB-associated Cys-rich membrane protein n=1 Tax=Vibrio variabilis TaxID=990271 RepID=UPI000B2C30E7|nr:FeoB-associated Cys-rich membrane protein [Vibrio variabilis]
MFEQNYTVLDTLGLVAVVAIAIVYLYIRLVRKKASCGNGCGGCCSDKSKEKI